MTASKSLSNQFTHRKPNRHPAKKYFRQYLRNLRTETRDKHEKKYLYRLETHGEGDGSAPTFNESPLQLEELAALTPTSHSETAVSGEGGEELPHVENSQPLATRIEFRQPQYQDHQYKFHKHKLLPFTQVTATEERHAESREED